MERFINSHIVPSDMVKRTGSTLISLKELIIDLKKLSSKENANIWKRVAEELSKSTRRRRRVNVCRISKNIKEGEIALVPGKVLGDGAYDKKNTVAAFRFSTDAKEKINKTGKAISLRDLMKQAPKGQKVRIIG
jgi:large subunit ribosomal protein L18e